MTVTWFVVGAVLCLIAVVAIHHVTQKTRTTPAFERPVEARLA